MTWFRDSTPPRSCPLLLIGQQTKLAEQQQAIDVQDSVIDELQVWSDRFQVRHASCMFLYPTHLCIAPLYPSEYYPNSFCPSVHIQSQLKEEEQQQIMLQSKRRLQADALAELTKANKAAQQGGSLGCIFMCNPSARTVLVLGWF